MEFGGIGILSGLKDREGSKDFALTELNDVGFTFSQIADVLQWYLNGEQNAC
jgi:hypothetical protein